MSSHHIQTKAEPDLAKPGFSVLVLPKSPVGFAIPIVMSPCPTADAAESICEEADPARNGVADMTMAVTIRLMHPPPVNCPHTDASRTFHRSARHGMGMLPSGALAGRGEA